VNARLMPEPGTLLTDPERPVLVAARVADEYIRHASPSGRSQWRTIISGTAERKETLNALVRSA
jgi:hypothetical protein